MKGWLRLGILFLIITSCIVVGSVSAKNFNSCGPIYVGQTDIDLSDCVSSGTWIGFFIFDGPTPSVMYPIEDATSFDAPYEVGNWYLLNSDLSASDEYIKVKAAKSK